MKYLILLSSSAAIAAFDQATKLWIHTNMSLGESSVIIPGFFSFTYVRNKGGAFGIFSDSTPLLQTILFIIFPIIAFILIFNILFKLKKNNMLGILALSSIFGGAIGNFIDRIHFKYVVDFLDFHLPNGLAYPTFNIADSFVVMGVMLVAWLAYKDPKSMPI